jgi:hypothetical protein
MQAALPIELILIVLIFLAALYLPVPPQRR